MNISPARKSAFDALFKIEKENSFSSIILPLFEETLKDKDRSLCHKIVLGTLRKKLYLDEIIKKLTNKEINKFDTEVLIALRIGLYQLLFLDKIPAYSAINESVNLVKIARKKSAGGLVNAVLRKASKGETELRFKDEITKLSIETSHPKWLIDRWIRQFGFEETVRLAQANNQESRLTFRFTNKFYRSDKLKQNEILESFEDETEKSEVIDNCFIAYKFDDNLRELAQKGFIYFQDEGSQIISKGVELQEFSTFLDVCASPGSKITYVAGNKNVDVGQNAFVAGDIYSHRVNNLKANCKNQNVEFIDIVQYDAERDLPFADKSFDVVLVDAPCTGTGTIRSNPEIRYNLNAADILLLAGKQLAILQNASKIIKHGGKLIYSTCSLEVEENEEIISGFLDMNKDFEKITPVNAERFITVDDFARTYPHRDNMDGFFIAVLVRV